MHCNVPERVDIEIACRPILDAVSYLYLLKNFIVHSRVRHAREGSRYLGRRPDFSFCLIQGESGQDDDPTFLNDESRYSDTNERVLTRSQLLTGILRLTPSRRRWLSNIEGRTRNVDLEVRFQLAQTRAESIEDNGPTFPATLASVPRGSDPNRGSRRGFARP